LKRVSILLFLSALFVPSFAAQAGVLEKVGKIEIDPTVVEQPAKVTDAVAASLVRYELRAAVRDALLEEGDSPVHAHFVLDEYSAPGTAKRAANFGSGQTLRQVLGRLVFEDANGKELAKVEIHFYGNVGLNPAIGTSGQGRRPASDFERLLLDEIERLK
jgi:hypothetical protein